MIKTCADKRETPRTEHCPLFFKGDERSGGVKKGRKDELMGFIDGKPTSKLQIKN